MKNKLFLSVLLLAIFFFEGCQEVHAQAFNEYMSELEAKHEGLVLSDSLCERGEAQEKLIADKGYYQALKEAGDLEEHELKLGRLFYIKLSHCYSGAGSLAHIILIEREGEVRAVVDFDHAWSGKLYSLSESRDGIYLENEFFIKGCEQHIKRYFYRYSKSQTEAVGERVEGCE